MAKELTQIITVEITRISTVNDNEIDEIIMDDRNTSVIEQKLKETFAADKVEVRVKDFVRDKSKALE